MIEVLAGRVFATRNFTHIHHWKTKSYAQHVALGDFYDAIVGDIDAIVECYQGGLGLIDVPILPDMKVPKDILKHLEDEVVWIANNQDKICKGISAVSNLIDNLTGSYFKTIYKLKNLS